MSAKREEYSVRGTKSSWRHWKARLKRSVARLARRLGKKLLEDAPKKVTRGWSD